MTSTGGKKAVNMIQETLNHKVPFQRLHHHSFIFGYSIYTALYECSSGYHIISVI